jgi:hypothetical protein
LRVSISSTFIAPYNDIICIKSLARLLYDGGLEVSFITSPYKADVPAECGELSRSVVPNWLLLLVEPNYICLDERDSA